MGLVAELMGSFDLLLLLRRRRLSASQASQSLDSPGGTGDL